MSHGDTQKFSCGTCGKDFEITLEPHAPHAEDATPETCRFCGGELEETQAAAEAAGG